ncbi:MAG: hypothetical protein GY925_08045 [Actinomycetia bacterium]|nr:hypothetical protein [Actinomycetes bacterium]
MAAIPGVLIRRPRHRDLVARPRLASLGVLGRLTVITGPAGSGKSVLAGQLVDEADGSQRLLWTRLAPGWSQPDDLVALAAAAAGEHAPPDETPQTTPDLFATAGRLLDLLEAEPTVLVVEDIHEVAAGDAERLLAEVAGYLPDTSGVIVTSRPRPAELIGLVDSTFLSVIDAADLAFDDDEVADLLTRNGADPADASRLNELARGWPAALVVAADSGLTDEASFDALLGEILSPRALGDRWPLFQVASIVPYVDDTLLDALGIGSEATDRLGQQSAFLIRQGESWRLEAVARDHLRTTVADETADEWRRLAAAHLAEVDPIASIDLLIEAEDWNRVGDLLAANASQIGADRATRWLYRLPPEVRRRMPPVLSGGRATVNVSLAALAAQQQVDGATSDDELIEALLGLGSLELAMGELAEASATLEAALRLAESDHPAHAGLSELLCESRWLAGDAAGARAALADMATPWSQCLAAMIAMTEGDTAEASRVVAAVEGEVARALGAATAFNTNFDHAESEAAAAYEGVVDRGGRELTIVGAVHGHARIRAADLAGAIAVADQIDRTVGRHDQHARLTAALLRRRATQVDPTLGDPDRDARRVLDLRSRGYAATERFADALSGEGESSVPRAAGLEVSLLGGFSIAVDGVALSADAWKSRKAQEVCAFLAHSGPAGATREQAIEAVWPGREVDKGRTLLRTALSEIRRVLEPRRGAGQESRFVTTAGSRVVALGDVDLVAAQTAATNADHSSCFALVSKGIAPELPDSDWVDELRPLVERMTIESASRLVVQAEAGSDEVVAAFEALITAEPWNKAHFDGLIARHRAAGDDQGATDIERRWFADG